jgi:hypothetical protein
MQAREPAADDLHVGVTTAVLGAPLALVLRRAQLAQAGGVAQRLLVQRPQPPRADEGLVVEARRRERAADRVGDRHDVVLEAGGGVEVLDAMPSSHRLGAGAHPGAPSTATRQFGHWPAQHSRPRRRWYLKLRENVRWPAA